MPFRSSRSRSAVNDPPAAGDQSATTAQTTAITLTLSASDLDSASLSFVIVTGPSHGTLGSITGTTCTPNGSGGSSCTAGVTYTPAGYAGPDAFTCKAYDGTAYSSEAKVSITVTGTNYAFSGFFQPVDNPPTVNTVNSGQSIPEKWQLFDLAPGAPISDPTSFVSFKSYQRISTTRVGAPSMPRRLIRPNRAVSRMDASAPSDTRSASAWPSGEARSLGDAYRAGATRSPASRPVFVEAALL